MRKVLEVILCIFTGIFLFGIIAITVQVIGEDSSNKASIIGGILSMIGGAIGALGAYVVAAHQMSKQLEQEKKKIEYEKKKEERQKKENIVHILKILERLNYEAMDFVDYFNKEFSKPYNQERIVKLKFSESDLLWIVNNVNNINYEILKEDFSLDYLRFSREVNNMYIDIVGIEHIPEEFKANNLSNLRKSLMERNKIFKTFDEYVKEQIVDIQKQIQDLS
ncbi:hypothetical protein ACULLL_01640 [Lysinibacillus irui]|uniref:hypothetical protein n=1 Tax=Lysinibacillus irui TaxID=2998077 RepID=UPI0040446B70